MVCGTRACLTSAYVASHMDPALQQKYLALARCGARHVAVSWGSKPQACSMAGPDALWNAAAPWKKIEHHRRRLLEQPQTAQHRMALHI